MSNLANYFASTKAKINSLLVTKNTISFIPSRNKRIPTHKMRFAGDGDLSHTDPGKLTDIRYYQYLDKSHLHKWDARSPKRNFLLKLEALERKSHFGASASQVKTAHPDEEALTNKDQVTLKLREKVEQTTTDDIILPTYIERSPSTILRLLASCVDRDNTAPDYKYHDDPFLIPYTSGEKKEYILAKDGGQRAARFVLDNHPELFVDNLIYDEPKVSKFLPKIQTKGKERNINFLKDLLAQYIESFYVSGAMEVYNLLEQSPKGIEKVDDDMKQNLLELLCYSNNDEEMRSEDYQLLAGMYLEQRTPWKVDGLAEQIYTDIITSKSSSDRAKDNARLAILSGRGKFKRVEGSGSFHGASNSVGATQMKVECEKNGTKLGCDAYNAAISSLPSSKIGFGDGKAKLLDILAEMNHAGIKPNEQSLYNISLYLLHLLVQNSTSHNDAQNTLLSLLSEFRHIGIEPSLGTFENLIKIFDKSKYAGKSHPIISDVITELETKQKSKGSIGAIIPDDFTFFLTAMGSISQLNNIKLAYRTHKLIVNEGAKGPALLGVHATQTLYYKHFMATVLRNESIDVSMELYSTLVPHVFTPNIDFYRQLIQEIDIQKGHNHLPKIWIDLGASNFTGFGLSKIEQKMEIMERFAASMQYADLEIFSDFDDGENESKLILLQTFTRIGKEMFEEIKKTAQPRSEYSKPRFQKRYSLSNNLNAVPIFNHLIDLAIRKSSEDTVVDFDLVKNVIGFSQDNITSLPGTLNGDILLKIVEKVVEFPLPGNRELGLTSIYYAAENRLPEALQIANTLLKEFTEFDENEKKQLNQLFAHEGQWTNL